MGEKVDTLAMSSANELCKNEEMSEIKLDKSKDIDSGKSENSNQTEDPYAYLDKNGFSSEKFKIEIRGLPKYFGLYELRKLLNNKLGLNCNKIKSPGTRSQWVYACFRSEIDREQGLKVLKDYKWKGGTFAVKRAEPAPDPLIKRRNEERTNEPEKKRMKLETVEQQQEALKNSVTPLWSQPYELQLKEKSNNAELLLRRLSSELLKENWGLSKWIEEQKKRNNGLICNLLPIRGLPEHCDYYRNKCEFTIGINELSGERTVGFRLGSYASGSLSVAPVHCLKNVSRDMLGAVEVFEKYVRGSKLNVFAPETLQGNWRQLTVRVGTNTGQIMLIIGFHPQNLTEEEMATVKEDLKEFFTNGAGAGLHITSLYFQISKRKENAAEILPCELLIGEKYIEEILCGIKFKISPQSFFQVNTRCAELLMDSVKTLSNINNGTTVLDVCCGTGTIGLCMAKGCGQVLGIEIIEEAVMDAKKNAVDNGIENCEFFCGKADDILGSVVKRAKGEHIVAIVDPPRAGLHNKAITLLRKINNLERIIYLSCNPKSAFKNFLEFGRPQSKKMVGLPFVPVMAVPVDMFPHSSHYEMVIYFERLDLAQKNQQSSVPICQENDQAIKKKI